MPKILITRRAESFEIEVDSYEDAEVIMDLLSTAKQRARLLMEVKAFFATPPA